jgi:probable phosphoglycerate mutase
LRVSTALNRILHEHEGKTIAIVCHGGVVDSSFIYFFGLGSLTLPQVRFYTHNTSITHWRKSELSDRPAQWRLMRYNDDLHVRDIDLPARISWENLPSSRKYDTTKTQPSIAPSEK